MSRLKRGILMGAIIVIAMLIIPLITIQTVKADAGMLVTMLLFFILHPIVSAAVGIIAGCEMKFFWFSPILLAGLFWGFSCLTYQTAFPTVYSAIYFTICSVSMLITWGIKRKAKAR